METHVNTDRTYAKLASASYDFNKANSPSVVEGYVRNKKYDTVNSVSGFSGCVFEKGNEVVIAFRGTDPEEADETSSRITMNLFSFGSSNYDKTGDAGSNLSLKKDEIPMQYQDAMQLYTKVKNAPENKGKKIVITGHSLGGSLTQLVASTPNKDGQKPDVRGITFNAYGRKSFVEKNDNFTDYNNTSNYLIPGDCVANTNNHIGTTLVFPLCYKVEHTPVTTEGKETRDKVSYSPDYTSVANPDEYASRPSTLRFDTENFHSISLYTNSCDKIWQSVSEQKPHQSVFSNLFGSES